jgi:hypothetical protein
MLRIVKFPAPPEYNDSRTEKYLSWSLFFIVSSPNPKHELPISLTPIQITKSEFSEVYGAYIGSGCRFVAHICAWSIEESITLGKNTITMVLSVVAPDEAKSYVRVSEVLS